MHCAIKHNSSSKKIYFLLFFILCYIWFNDKPVEKKLLFTVFMILLALLIIFRKKVVLLISPFIKIVMKFIDEKPIKTLILFLLVISFLVYHNFIIQKVDLIWRDIGSDSYFQFYPSFAFLSDYIRVNGIPRWSFQIGLGTNYYPTWITDPFTWLIVIFPKQQIASIIIYVHILKTVLAGILFYYYLKTIHVSNYSAFVASILYAFNGHMVARGATWYHYATECVFVPLLLIALERYLQDKDWRALPFFGLIIYMNGSGVPYYLYLYSILMFIYLTVRYIQINNWEWHKYLKFIVKLIGFYLLGICLMAVFLLPDVANSLNSPRINNNGLLSRIFPNNMLSFDNIKAYLAWITRAISSDMEGIRSTDYLNYLEAPLLYSGLISLLLLPQVIKNINKRNKVVIITAFTMGGLYILFPYIRFLFNGFLLVSYKNSSFYLLVLLIIGTAWSLDHIQRGDVSNPLLIGTGVILMVVLIMQYLSRGSSNTIIDLLTVIILAFLITYTILFYTYISQSSNKSNLHSIILGLIIFCTIIEVTVLSSVSVVTGASDSARAINTNSLKRDKQGYEDWTGNAIEALPSNGNEFYRIEKDYWSVSLCDSLYQNYNGTKDYSSLHGKDVIQFNKQLGLQDAYWEESGHYLFGFADRDMLQSLTGTKYFLSKQKSIALPFEYISKIGDVNIYKNPYSLPLGFVYDKYLSEKDFTQLAPLEKDMALLSGVMLSDKKDNVVSKSIRPKRFQMASIMGPHNLKIVKNNFPDSVVCQVTEQDPQIEYKLDKSNGEAHYIYFTIVSPSAASGQLFWRTKQEGFSEKRSFRFNLNAGYNKKFFVLDQNDIDFVRLDIDNVSNFQINSFGVYPDYHQWLDEIINERRESSFNIKFFSNNLIKGNINVKDDGFLFFSIPYDKGWHIRVDGIEKHLDKANIMFMGLPILKGEHNIELYYKVPYLNIGITLTSFGLFMYFVLLYLWKFDKKKRIV